MLADARTTVVLAGAAAGLAAAPLAAVDPASAATVGALALGALAATPKRRRGPRMAAAFALALAAGALFGDGRVAAIDGGAYRGSPGSRASVAGFVAAVPRRSDGEVRVEVETADGKLLLRAPEPVPDLPIGSGVRAEGELADPPDWLRSNLRRDGVALVLRTSRISSTGRERAGLWGLLDRIRRRAEQALGAGMPPREAALARGFVLGEDDRIDSATVDDFRRSGLSHLLAVSGQNVVLLTLLAAPLLAALAIPLRARLLWTLGLIALYVPLAGAGPSIQRAGVMGAAAVLATLAGRPASRLYALLAAAVVTLALNPRASGDVGWQLSFAAVVGIFVAAGPLRRLLGARLPGGWASAALAEGAAVTIAATVATAPLIAFHFGTFSAASLPANLLAMPAVAPAMWLGMIVAAAGQVPHFPVGALNAIEAPLLGYVAQIAAWLGRPGWASLQVGIGGLGLLGSYLAALVLLPLAMRGLKRRRERRRQPRPLRVWLIAAAGAFLVFAAIPVGRGAEAGADSQPGLRVEVLDVGQGDAILLQPRGAPAVLVDGGPPGDEIAAKLRQAGVEALGAAVVTHDQADHSGGIADLLGELPVARLAYADAGRPLLARARAAGAAPYRVAEGSELRSGSLRLEVLWPPREPGGLPPGSDPNERSLVLLARWRRFSMLLTGDAEAEAVPISPGPVDVLKVAHHGSDDAGLDALLDRSAPKLALISVGADNPFGHPTASTLRTLARHRVRVLRTDRDGTIDLDVTRSGMGVIAGG